MIDWVANGGGVHRCGADEGIDGKFEIVVGANLAPALREYQSVPDPVTAAPLIWQARRLSTAVPRYAQQGEAGPKTVRRAERWRSGADGYTIWERMQAEVDERIKAPGC